VVEELEIAVFRQRREPGKTRVTALVLGNSQLSLKTEDDGKESAKLDFQYTGVPLNEVRLSNRGDLAAVRTDGSQVALADLKLDPRHEVLEGDPVATCGWPYGIQLHEGKTILSSFLLGHRQRGCAPSRFTSSAQGSLSHAASGESRQLRRSGLRS
jgi:hypothetical protein